MPRRMIIIMPFQIITPEGVIINGTFQLTWHFNREVRDVANVARRRRRQRRLRLLMDHWVDHPTLGDGLIVRPHGQDAVSRPTFARPPGVLDWVIWAIVARNLRRRRYGRRSPTVPTTLT